MMKYARCNQRLFERRDERTRFDEIADQWLTAERYALAGDRRLDHLLVLAEVKGAGGFELTDAERGEPGTPIHVHGFRADIIEMQKSVIREILRPFQRTPVVTQERRAADRNHLLAEQSDRTLRHRLGLAVADGEVDQAPLQIERVGRGRDPHIDIRVKRSEAPESRNEPERREAGRGGDRELAGAGFGSELVGRCLQPIEHVGRNPIEGLSILCQRK